MIRWVSFILAAILCHSPVAWAEGPELAPAITPDEIRELELEPKRENFVQHLRFAIFVLQTAQHRRVVRRCLSERCMERSKAKAVGWAAVYFLGINVLRKYVSTRYFGSSMAAYATKTAARLGLTFVGVASADAVLIAAIAYESTFGLIGPVDSPGIAESILFNQEHLDRLLSMDRHQIFRIAMNDKIIAEELIAMAHHTILATFPEFQVVWENLYLPPPPKPQKSWVGEYPIFPTP